MRRHFAMAVVAGILASAGCQDHQILEPESHTPLRPSFDGGSSGGGTSGRIVFLSGQDGNPDIYSMNADGSGVTRLTDDPALDFMPAWSPDGSKIVFSSDRDGSTTLWTMNADGTNQTQLTSGGFRPNDFFASWSPDGARIVFSSSRAGDQEIFVVDVDGSNLTNLTNNDALDYNPVWSPDGTRIAFSSEMAGNQDIWVMNADGSSPVQLTTDGAIEYTPAWSPDGQLIAFASERFGGVEEVMLMNADGSNQVRVTNSPSEDFLPWFSPDGTKLLFSSLRSGNYDLYTMNLDGSAIQQLTSGPSNEYDGEWIAGGGSTNQPPAVSAGGPYTGQEGSPVALTLTATDPDGDALAIHWDLGDGATGTGALPTSHTYSDNGTYIVTVSADDGHGGQVTSTTTATVSNAAPVLSPVSGPNGSVLPSASVSVSATFTDAGVQDVHNSTIAWGDGAVTSAGVTESGGAGSVGGSHSYASPGTYTVTVTVTDNAGGSGSETRTVAVTGATQSGFWMGLKNTPFDLRVELLKNGVVVASGQVNAVTGGSNSFNSAVQQLVSSTQSSTPGYTTGDVLGIKLSVRLTPGVQGHPSGNARLWYNDGTANSRASFFVNGQERTYYLLSGFGLSMATGTGARLSIDVSLQEHEDGNAFKTFGTWQVSF